MGNVYNMGPKTLVLSRAPSGAKASPEYQNYDSLYFVSFSCIICTFIPVMKNAINNISCLMQR